MDADLHILNYLLCYNLILRLMYFYYDDNLHLDNSFHHKINNEIYLLMYIMISFEMNLLLILLPFSLVFYDDFHFLIHFYDVYLMMIFHPIFPL